MPFFLLKRDFIAKIPEMKTYLKIGLNSLSQLLSRLVSASVTLLVTILITRNLSKDFWGDFVTVMSYIAMFSLIADFGLNGLVLKNFTAAEDKVEEGFRELLGLRVLLGLVAIFLGLAILSFVPHSVAVKTGIIVGLLMIIFQGVFTTSSVIFQHKLRYDLFAISDILGSLSILLLVFLATLVKAPLVLVVAIFVLGTVVKAAVSLLLAQRLVAVKGISFNFPAFRSLIIASLPLGLMLLFSQINNNVDKQILALTDPKLLGMASAVAVGIYGLAYRIFDFSVSAPTYIVNSAYPILLSKRKENLPEFSRLTRELLGFLVAAGGLLAIVGWFLTPTVLTLFGSYSESILPTRILLLGLPVFFATSLLVWLVVALNREIVLPFIFGFAALVNIVLNLVFIPKFGYNAAAWVTIVTELVILALLSVVLAGRINIFQNNEKDT